VLASGAELRVRLAADAPEARSFRVAWEGTVLAQGVLDSGAEHRATFPAGTVRVECLRAGEGGELEVLETKTVRLATGDSVAVDLSGGGGGDRSR